MTHLEQNFETPDKPLVFHGSSPALPKKQPVKYLLIFLPLLVFLLLLLFLVSLSSQNKKPVISTETPAPSLPASHPNPSAYYLKMEAERLKLQEQDINQPDLALPSLDLDVKF